MLTTLNDLFKVLFLVFTYLSVLPPLQIKHIQITNTKPLKKSYDFIIIGAGTAGSVLASRLSENPKTSVLLLETGGLEGVLTDIPSISIISRRNLDHWNYFVDGKGKAFVNNDDGQGYLPRGKGMGGSSSVNNMIYLRGSRKVYDEWAEMGLDNWSWDKVFPYFKKSEKNLDKEYQNELHGVDGPFIVSTPGKTFGPSQVYQKATEELGFEKIDLNNPDQKPGCNIGQRNIDSNNVRVSVSRAYLEPVANHRPNLTILTFAFVTKILFQNKTAIGVEFDHNEMPYTVKANKEVILSAGAVNSPQLLMLSGVGPSKELKKHKIKTVIDLPGVGQNVHDHVYVPLPNIGCMFDPIASPAFPLFYLYVDLSQFICHAKSRFNQKYPDYPDIQIDNQYYPLVEPFGVIVNSLFNLNKSAYYHYYGPYFFKPIFMTVVVNLRPKSRGWIKLISADPYDYPVIQPNYLKHPDDVKVIIDGIKWVYQFGKTETFKSKGCEVFKSRVLGCQHLDKEDEKGIPSDDYLECAVRRHTHTGYHICGSCKMGPNNDAMTVVDQDLKVKGVEKLRVVDASVIPKIPNANTNAVVVMIAEKAADIIKMGYGL